MRNNTNIRLDAEISLLINLIATIPSFGRCLEFLMPHDLVHNVNNHNKILGNEGGHNT